MGLVVYTSILHADTSALPPAAEHRATEAALRSSGLPFVILRNGWYTENYAFWVKRALEDGTVLGSAGDGRIASASHADYAEAAAIVLSTGGQEGRTFELAGDDPFTMEEFSATVAELSGEAVGYRNLPRSGFRDALVAMGTPGGAAEMLAACDAAIAEGGLDDRSGQLRELIGRATTPYRRSLEIMIAEERRAGDAT